MLVSTAGSIVQVESYVAARVLQEINHYPGLTIYGKHTQSK